MFVSVFTFVHVSDREETDQHHLKSKPAWPCWMGILNWLRCTTWSRLGSRLLYCSQAGIKCFASVKVVSVGHRINMQNRCLSKTPYKVTGLSLVCVLQNAVDEVIEMYLELHMWDECIAVAEARVIKPPTLLCSFCCPCQLGVLLSNHSK